MNPRPKLIWQFYPFYLLISLLSFACVLFVARDAFFSSHTAADSSGWLTGRVFMWALATALLTTAASVAVIMHISRSLEKTREGARRFAEGDLGFRLDVPQSAELGGLAETLNRMAAQLNERITTINRQRNEQDAILGSMAEGVIAVDKNAAILQLNNAAATLLDATPESIIGRPLPELMRNRNLLQLIETTLEEGIPSEGEIAIHGRIDRSLEIHCTALKNPDGASIGALIVLNDITRLRRLEGVRRDFVANVSHELKTPLTSIKGFVETLQDGALDQPLEARRFCAIIAKQVDRLQAIIEDLLSLSRIEQEVEDGQVVLKEGKLRDVLTSAAQCCELQAAEKNISVNIECNPEWTARFNDPLFEQVAVNLIDNAIKYSDPGKNVKVRVNPTETNWVIQFIDQGCGIEQSHLPRIFERFYRVDKARSRKVGGTGLGLAIVKHIVTSHGGHITVESQPGTGSSFIVYLPRFQTVNPTVQT
jgi:two-component system, OmpR family, phosphate regulon sensor histidine kinase PhoR